MKKVATTLSGHRSSKGAAIQSRISPKMLVLVDSGNFKR